MSTRVLVTGGSGFVAGHLVQKLLASEYDVRATVRSLGNAAKVEPLRRMATMLPGRLELFEADLLEPGAFDEAIARLVRELSVPVVAMSRNCSVPLKRCAFSAATTARPCAVCPSGASTRPAKTTMAWGSSSGVSVCLSMDAECASSGLPRV